MRQELADLLTPITKAWCSDLGSELTRLATQTFGGAGYVEETGVAQHERDVRIAAIYEGTNGIQAIDLVTRKLPMREGGVVGDLVDAMDATAAELETRMPDLSPHLKHAVEALRQATAWLLGPDRTPEDLQAAATPYLRLFGTVLGGWFQARQAVIVDGSADPFDEAKLATARYYCIQVLPAASGLLPAVTAGADALADAHPLTVAPRRGRGHA